MTHPLDQLAPFVDGSLPAAERADVERHLASCPGCRYEVSFASQARTTLRSLTEVPAPRGLGDAALVEMAEQERKAAAGGRPRWTRFVPIAAAAVVVGLLAIALPRIGDSDEDSGGVAASAPGRAAASPGSLRLELQHTDYDPDSLGAAAREFAAAQTTPAVAAPQEDAGAVASGSPAPASLASPAQTGKALACLRSAFPDFPGRPVRLIRASFEGTPAYLAYVLEGPGAGQAPDTVSIWVASLRDCGILSFSTVNL
jgi:anti-sigma factor RsiW